MENSCGNSMLNAVGNSDANSLSKHITCSSEETTTSIGSASSSDELDDTSSLSPMPRHYRFSDINTTQLPMKKGLSRYYLGKSKTFTSLSCVRCVQDVAKNEIPIVKRGRRSFHSPKAVVSKKNTRGHSNSLVVKDFFRPPSA